MYFIYKIPKILFPYLIIIFLNLLPEEKCLESFGNEFQQIPINNYFFLDTCVIRFWNLQFNRFLLWKRNLSGMN